MSTTVEPRQRRRRMAAAPAAAPRREVLWHESAPATLRRAAGRNQPDRLWSAWTALLARRRPKLPRLFRNSEVLTAGMVLTREPGRLEGLIELLCRVTKGKPQAVRQAVKQLHGWLKEAALAPCSVEYALECLAWVHAMPQLASQMPAQSWWELFWHAMDASAEARRCCDDIHPLAAALLGAEVPLTLAALFPEIQDCRRAKKAAEAFLPVQLADRTAEERLLASDGRAYLRPMFACWTRCRALSRSKGKWLARAAEKTTSDQKQLGREARRAFRRALLAVMRWTGGDRRPMLLAGETHDPVVDDMGDLLHAATKLDGSREVARAYRGFRTKKRTSAPRANKRPCAGTPYEASGAAVLRSDWSPKAVALALDFSTQDLQWEFRAAGETMFGGTWDVKVRVAGQPATAPILPWDMVCWETNRRSQWLELEMKLADGVRIERGLLLAPQDELALLIDVVVGPAGQELEYQSGVTLGAGMRAKEERETRELTVLGQQNQARILPLALGEWRSDPRVGRLNVESDRLILRQQSREGATCAMLFIDYSRQRRKAPLTWRPLTIGQERRMVPRDAAVGYRVQIGEQQWLVYRTVRSRANRTLLGQNLATEFKVARFLSDGDAKTIMEIE